MLPSIRQVCSFVAIREVFGLPHRPSRQLTRRSLGEHTRIMRSLAKYSRKKLSADDPRRDGARVGFCSAATEMMFAPSFEIPTRPIRIGTSIGMRQPLAPTVMRYKISSMSELPGRNAVGAIILAAGASTRMGVPKQLLQFGGEIMLCLQTAASQNL